MTLLSRRGLRTFLAAMFIAALSAPGLAASASASVTGTAGWDASDDVTPIVVDGSTFGPDDGLVVTEGSTLVGVGGSALRANASYTWGSSFARSRERLQFWYDGSARAAANVFSSKRIVQVCFQYKRGTSNVGGACSNASFRSCPPSSGSTATKTVRDSLDPNAPVTRFTYSTSRINPSVC